MAAVLPDPFYYLENFQRVLGWINAHHQDLLDDRERGLMERVTTLPRLAQALLVRMVMRKGDLFRHSKLAYAEIGDIAPLTALLHEHGLIETQPLLTLEQLFGLLRKEELQSCFKPDLGKTARKDDMLALLLGKYPAAQPLPAWHPHLDDSVSQLLHTDVYDRLRLMFFGNLYQDWSEFVLTDLGLLKYEAVEIPPSSRAFQQRADVDSYLHLYACRERLEAGDAPQTVLADIPGQPYNNPWLEERRAKLLFHMGQHLERQKCWADALTVYQASSWPPARVRAIRVLEQDQQAEAAYQLASALLDTAPREEESQQLARMLPRLRRKLGLEKIPQTLLLPPERMDLVLEPAEGLSVEMLVRDHIHQEHAPAFYVENALINSLFGLLCWPAIFAPLPGAFFHAFHYGPVDLHSPDFLERRQAEFSHCLEQLASSTYRDTIISTWREKYGTQSPFVFWDALSEELITLALDCIPPDHLHWLFQRLLVDIKNNRSGFPDLIQFWPQEQRYLMLEIKGPGDRLQDNQIRWLDYCIRHGIPVAVSHVSWATATS